MSRADRDRDQLADDRLGPARAGAGLVVEPARTAAPRGSLALLAGVALAAAVVALAVAGLLSPVPLALPSPDPALGSASPSASDAAPSDAVPSLPLVVREVGSGDAAVAELARLVGWTTCPVWREFGIGAPVTRRDVEAAVRATGVDAGPVDVTDADGHVQRVWLGGDAGTAVRGLGGAIIVRDADTVWTVIVEEERTVAVRLVAGVRRDGGTFWQIRGRASLAPFCTGTVGVDGPVTVVRVTGGGQARLFAEAGWAACKTWQRTGRAVLPTPESIDAAARAAGLDPAESGWAGLPLGEGYGAPVIDSWLGLDAEEAARAHGAGLIVVDEAEPASAWMRVEFGGREIAVQFRILETPDGHRAWLATPNAAGAVSGCEAAG